MSGKLPTLRLRFATVAQPLTDRSIANASTGMTFGRASNLWKVWLE